MTESKQIRISGETYRRLERRKREDESFDAVVDRLLDDDRDLLAGFGRWEGTDAAEAARRTRERGKAKSRERTRRAERDDDR